MNENYRLADARNANNKLLKLEARFRFAIILVALTTLFERATAQENTIDYWMDKGNMLLSSGQWDEACEAYNRAIEIDPQSYNAWWRKAEVLGRNGDINKSVKAYDKAIELIPANNTIELADAWTDKAETLAYADQWEDALEAQNRALELDPRGGGRKWHFTAFILMNLDRREEALLALNKALEQNPTDISNWQCKASLLAQMKRYNESMEAYDKAIGLLPGNDTEEIALTWMAKGEALNNACKPEAARAAFRKALELCDIALAENPGDISLLQSKGRALFDLGRYNNAIEVYDQIIETSSSIEPFVIYAFAWAGKGDALLELGKGREALLAYNKAIKTSPNFSTAWYGKGKAEKSLGQAYNASMSLLVAQKLGYEK